MVGEARLQRDIRERLRNLRSVAAQSLQLPPRGQNPLFAASAPELLRPPRKQRAPPEHDQSRRGRQQQQQQPCRAARRFARRRDDHGGISRLRFAVRACGIRLPAFLRLLPGAPAVRRLGRRLRRFAHIRHGRCFRSAGLGRRFRSDLFGRWLSRRFRGRFRRRFGRRHRSAAGHLHGRPAKAVAIDLDPRMRIRVGHARPFARRRVHQIAAHVPGRHAERLQHGGGGAGKVHAVAAMALRQKILDEIRSVGRALGLEVVIARLPDIVRDPVDNLPARHRAVDAGLGR